MFSFFAEELEQVLLLCLAVSALWLKHVSGDSLAVVSEMLLFSILDPCFFFCVATDS